MRDDEKNKIISRIIELESIVTGAYFKGHKAHNQDQYQTLRDELKVLRNILTMNTKKYCIKLRHNLTDIVLGEKILIPEGEIILDNISGDTLSLLEFPLVVREHGNGIKTFAQKTDCIIEEL